ncbi:MAG: hypothetical protein FVQ79_08875 [Planctomycetes bacterium]|nr:hypothetical protein [Planctomycetota bacterium]
MPIIIDGYNLLRWVQSIDSAYADLDEAPLCRMISLYLIRTRNRAQVIFDGVGPPDKRELANIANMEVYFSGPDREADDIIEDKILESSAPKGLVVVSSDRRIRTAAQKRKATSVKADYFWLSLIEQLDKKKPMPEPKEKRNGISEHEADQWLNEFGLDD